MLKPKLLEKTDFHIFYYVWYGNPTVDGQWLHWAENGHTPANDDIPSAYFPKKGLYSSHDPLIIGQHMQEIASAGIGVVVISWWGQGTFEDLAVPLVMDAAQINGLKVAFIMENYGGHTVASHILDIAYIYDNYGNHPSFYRVSKPNKWGASEELRGVFYMYDAYGLLASDWITAVDAIRGTEYDAILMTNNNPKSDTDIVDAIHFDGLYNYDILLESGADFANCGSVMAANNTLWSPTVGPGFDDKRERNGNPNILRSGGNRLSHMFKLAYASNPTFISVTSFNEWHESTQIEPAMQKSISGFDYLNYNGDFGKKGVEAETEYLRDVAFWTSKNSRKTI